MTRDTSGQTFAGGRLAQQMDYQAFRPFQDFIARKFCIPVYRRWLAMAVLSRTVIAPGYFENPRFWEACEFMPPGWSRGINPLHDSNSSIASKEAGITTLAEECAFNGKDWKRQLRLAGRSSAWRQFGADLARGEQGGAGNRGRQSNDPDPEAAELLKEKTDEEKRDLQQGKRRGDPPRSSAGLAAWRRGDWRCGRFIRIKRPRRGRKCTSRDFCEREQDGEKLTGLSFLPRRRSCVRRGGSSLHDGRG